MKIKKLLGNMPLSGRTKRISLNLLFFAVLLINMGINGQSVAAINQNPNPNTSSTPQQAFPSFDHYWFMNVFTGEGLNASWNENQTLNINYKMDDWNYYQNSSSYEVPHVFRMYNFTDRNTGALKFLGIYGDSMSGISTTIPEPWDWSVINGSDTEYSQEHIAVTGGYSLDAYDPNYFYVKSNTTLIDCVMGNQPNNYTEALSFDTLMQRDFNISSNLLLSRNNLTAEMFNGTQIVPCDNPLYFNITVLQQTPLGADYMLNGMRYVMTVKNTTFYQLFNEDHNYTLTIKPTGELWCITMGQMFSQPLEYGINHSLMPYYLTWDTVEIWFGWHHYVNHNYMASLNNNNNDNNNTNTDNSTNNNDNGNSSNNNNNNTANTNSIIGGIIGVSVGAVVVSTGVVANNRMQKKGRDPNAENMKPNVSENDDSDSKNVDSKNLN